MSMFKLPKLQNVWLRLFLVSPYKGSVAAGTPFFKSYFIIYNKLAGKEADVWCKQARTQPSYNGGGSQITQQTEMDDTTSC